MRNLLSARPALWFLFVFNLSVAVVAPIAVGGPQGLVTAAGMGVVSLGAGAALMRRAPRSA